MKDFPHFPLLAVTFTTMRRLGPALTVLAALRVLTAAAPAAELAVQATPVPFSDQKISNVTVSPDGEHIAFVAPKGSRFVAVIDGQPGERFDEVGHPGLNAEAKVFLFAPIGRHLRYLGRSGEEFHVIIDDQNLPGYDLFSQTCFSPDGKQCAFVGENNVHSDYHVVVNGTVSPSYRSEVKGLQFSASGHVAYVADTTDKTTHGYRRFLVIDGKPEAPFADVLSFQFSADGNHWAYFGRDNAIPLHYGDPKPPEKAHLMVDGREVAVFETGLNLALSADGRHVAYVARLGTSTNPDQSTLAHDEAGLDGQTWTCDARPANGIQPATLVLSAAGDRIAWVQKGQYSAQVFVNGKAGASYDSIQQLTFSPDGQHVYCFGHKRSAQGETVFVAADDDEWGPYTRTINGAEPAAFRFVFSPDGKHVAFESGDGKNCFVVRDGKSGAPYDHVYGELTFSPDSQHLAYFADKDRLKNLSPIARQQAAQSPDFDPGHYLVIDETEQREPRGTTFGQGGNSHQAVYFSPDSQHTAYLIGTSGIVVDGRTVPLPSSSGVESWYQSGSTTALAFSPDSSHLVFAAAGFGTPSGPALYIDGNKVPGFGLIAPPVFPERDTVMFFAKNTDTGAIDRVSVALGSGHGFGAADGAPAAAGGGAGHGASSSPPAVATGSSPGMASAPAPGNPVSSPPTSGAPALSNAVVGMLPENVGAQAAPIVSAAAPLVQMAFYPGTKIEVKMTEAVDSAQDPAGRQYQATVVRRVVATHGVAIPAGAAAVVTVVQDDSGAAAHLASVSVNGQTVPVNGSSATVVSRVNRAARTASSLLGAFGARARQLASAADATASLTATSGSRVYLPQGTELTFDLGTDQ